MWKKTKKVWKKCDFMWFNRFLTDKKLIKNILSEHKRIEKYKIEAILLNVEQGLCLVDIKKREISVELLH